MSVVKKRIASFEAQNETIKLSSPSSSPGRPSMSTTAATMMKQRYARRNSPSSYSKHQQEKQQQQMFEAVNMMDDSSMTDMAAQSRRTRLSKEKDVTHHPQEPQSGMSDRRRARQRLKDRKTRIAQRHKPIPLQSPPQPESRRPQPVTSRISHEPISSHRRFVHSISAESDNAPDENLSNSSSLVSMSRASPARRARQQQLQENSDDCYGRTATGAVDATDDDVTLTSVRQIMTPEQNLTVPILRTTSSSSFETVEETPIESNNNGMLYPSNSNAATTPSRVRQEENFDDDTYDYADWNASTTDVHDTEDDSVKEARRLKKRQEQGYKADGTPLINRDDMDYYRKNLDTPLVKTAAGVMAAAAVGTAVMGPVGVLVGAAIFSVGVGFSQIPSEQQANMKTKAHMALGNAKESVMQASETLSAACAATCMDSGLAEQIPNEMKHCFTQEADEDQESSLANTNINTSTNNQSGKHSNGGDRSATEVRTTTSGRLGGAGVAGASGGGGTGGMYGANGGGLPSLISAQDGHVSPMSTSRSRKVTCMRQVPIIPMGQIHGLPL